MGTQLSPGARDNWDDEIDLREYVLVLLRWKWIILGLVGAAVVGAAALSYSVISPAYKSSGSFLPPAADGTDEIGMSSALYRAFAESDRVLEGVLDRTGLPLTLQNLREDVLEVNLKSETGMLSVAATASTANNAYRIVTAWQQSFNAEVSQYVEDQLSRKLHLAEATVESLTPTLGAAAGSPRLLEARLEQDRLVGMRSQLSELTEAHALIAPTLPLQPISPNTTLNMAIAGVLAAFVGVFFAFVKEWWVNGQPLAVPSGTESEPVENGAVNTHPASPASRGAGGQQWRPERPSPSL